MLERLRELLRMQSKAMQPIRKQPRRIITAPPTGTPFKLAGCKEQADV